MTDAEWLTDVERTARSVNRQNQCGANRPVELAASEVLKLVAGYRPDGVLRRELEQLKAPEFDNQSARFDRIDKLIGRLSPSASDSNQSGDA